MLEIIAKDEDILIRKMEPDEADFRLFLKWMTDPETMKYWEGMTEHFTYERVVEHYWEHVEEDVAQCIIEYKEKPIGYCQFCVLNAEYFEVPEELYEQFVKAEDRVYGIDMFLGEVEWRNQGLGTRSMKVLMKALFKDYHADAIMIDPKIHNTRAIRCYQKAGFQDLFVVPQREQQDGIYHDSLIMGVKKEDSYFEI